MSEATIPIDSGVSQTDSLEGKLGKAYHSLVNLVQYKIERRNRRKIERRVAEKRSIAYIMGYAAMPLSYFGNEPEGIGQKCHDLWIDIGASDKSEELAMRFIAFMIAEYGQNYGPTEISNTMKYVLERTQTDRKPVDQIVTNLFTVEGYRPPKPAEKEGLPRAA